MTGRAGQVALHCRPRPGTHGRSYVLLVPLESGETAGDLQQSGRPELGAAGDETAGVLNPEAEERVITHLLKEPEEPGRVGEETRLGMSYYWPYRNTLETHPSTVGEVPWSPAPMLV